MHIEWKPELGGYWTVRVDPGELRVESGKTMSFDAWIGRIRVQRKRVSAHVWTPAASVPKGYKTAAKELVARAVYELRHHHHRAETATEKHALEALRAARE